MLQQTQVRTVLPFYRQFLEHFPDLEALAAAEEDEVLALWSGLGYYRRARQLHRAARQVVADGGRFPATARQLEELPGIGPYTAAAVASIAFGEAVPVLDGNVERVLSRLLASSGDPKVRATRRQLLERARQLLDAERPGDSNQALMELGATLCRPRAPLCGECPLSRSCRGFQTGEPERYPPPRRRRRTERLVWSVALVRRRGRTLFFRRPAAAEILPGLWELPNVPYAPDLEEVERRLGQTYGGRWQLEAASERVRHTVTYRTIELQAHRSAYREVRGEERREAAWISAEERRLYGLSSMFEKVLKGAGGAE